MTWRQILEGLAALPSALKTLGELRRTATVSIASLKESDVIVVETEHPLTQKGRENLTAIVKTIWPNNRVIVWDSGLTMRIVNGAEQREGVH